MSALLPFLMLLGGLGALAYGGAMLARARESETWPSVTGEVVRSEVVRDHNRWSRSRMRYFKPEIVYDYTVGGRRYRSSTVAAGGLVNCSWPGPAERYCARYPVGREVEVHYRPRDPGVACLEHGAQGGTFIGGVGAAFAAFALLAWAGVIPIH